MFKVTCLVALERIDRSACTERLENPLIVVAPE
jgi:hypothetical protein